MSREAPAASALLVAVVSTCRSSSSNSLRRGCTACLCWLYALLWFFLSVRVFVSLFLLCRCRLAERVRLLLLARYSNPIHLSKVSKRQNKQFQFRFQLWKQSSNHVLPPEADRVLPEPCARKNRNCGRNAPTGNVMLILLHSLNSTSSLDVAMEIVLISPACLFFFFFQYRGRETQLFRKLEQKVLPSFS